MAKFKDLLKRIFPPRIYTYEDFSIEVKNFIFKKTLLIPAFMVIAFFIGYFLRNTISRASLIAIWCSPILWIIYIYYLYNIFAYKKFVVIVGTVNEVVKNRTSITRNWAIYGKNYLTIECEDKNFEMDIKYADSYKEGNILKIYTRTSDFDFFSEDTFKIDPILICLVKNMDTVYDTPKSEKKQEVVDGEVTEVVAK